MATARSLNSREIGKVLKHLETLTYKQRRDFLWQRSRPRLSRFLYKFRPLQTEEDANRLREIMLMSQLWLSPVAAFNDPFDMSAKVITGTVDERRNRFRRELIQQGVRFKDIAPAVRRLMATSESESTAIARKLLRRDITAAGVCSFAGDPRSTLMWSHYGSNHKGLCLVFERARDPRTFLRAMEVEYSDEYPVVNMVKDLLRGLQAVILRKHPFWRYEKESRIIF